MKKKVFGILALLMICLSLAACGNKEESNSKGEETIPYTSTQQETEGDNKEPETSTPPESSTQPEETSAQPETSSEKATVRLAALKGPTAMGMVKLLADNEAGQTSNTYDFTMATSPDEIVPKLMQGEVDIAAIPSNLASVLYNKSAGNIRVAAVNTLGVLSIVSTDPSVKTWSDLEGKTILATGKQTVPELTLRTLLKKNGLDPDKDVTMDWKTEPTEVVGVLSKTGGIAMLPQPFVTVAQTKVKGLEIVLDLTDEWKSASEKEMVTGVVVVRKEFAETNKAALDLFLAEYASSIEFINKNVEEGAALVEKYDIVKAPIAKKAIPKCHLKFLSDAEMKSAVSSYLQLLAEEDSKAVGGSLPTDDFYYEK